MKLLNLKLTNFKGIKSLEINADGENLDIYGDNAVGKTTIFDGFQWLLFGKDSQNKADFGIKTLDASGNELHYLNHEVQGRFDINGVVVELRKVFAEKWTKRRGSASEDFTGHVTDHYIDGVPKSKKEYDCYINSIISEDKFKLLTNPDYFNNQLHWQERRKILLQICGDMSDAEVIASDKSLDKLTDILNGRAIDDHKKVIATRRSKINKELEEIPARIDEANRALPDVSGLSKEFLTAVISNQQADKQSKEQEISRIQNGGEVAEQQKLLAEINSRIADIQTRFRLENSDKSFAKKQELQGLKLKLNGYENSITSANASISSNLNSIKLYESQKEILLKKFREIEGRKFEISLEDTCPTCKQSLPENQLEEARNKSLANFNLVNSNELTDIRDRGTKIKEIIENLKKQVADHQENVAKLIIKKDDLQLSISLVEAEINGETGEVAKIEDDSEYIQAIKDKQSIVEKITALEVESQSVIDALRNDIQSIQMDIRSKESDLIKFVQVDGGQKRITELSNQEKMLAAEFEKLDSELFLIESFIRAKVGLLEDRINSKFKYARFKLFETQINGGLNECCETLINGVPFGSGLNNAAKINSGLDIINTLSSFYEFQPVIFVDNAESVTELIKTEAQVIRLVVSEPDKVLRIESEVM
jgi:DNA repair exonuclease SbcCD ATPase subunit